MEPTTTPNHGYGTRSEHMAWLKKRALAVLENKNEVKQNIVDAYTSMASDILKHPETQKHVGLDLGMMQIMGGFISTKAQMVEFINGLN